MRNTFTCKPTQYFFIPTISQSPLYSEEQFSYIAKIQLLARFLQQQWFVRLIADTTHCTIVACPFTPRTCRESTLTSISLHCNDLLVSRHNHVHLYVYVLVCVSLLPFIVFVIHYCCRFRFLFPFLVSFSFRSARHFFSQFPRSHTHTHTPFYVRMYVYMCVCTPLT